MANNTQLFDSVAFLKGLGIKRGLNAFCFKVYNEVIVVDNQLPKLKNYHYGSFLKSFILSDILHTLASSEEKENKKILCGYLWQCADYESLANKEEELWRIVSIEWNKMMWESESLHPYFNSEDMKIIFSDPRFKMIGKKNLLNEEECDILTKLERGLLIATLLTDEMDLMLMDYHNNGRYGVYYAQMSDGSFMRYSANKESFTLNFSELKQRIEDNENRHYAPFANIDENTIKKSFMSLCALINSEIERCNPPLSPVQILYGLKRKCSKIFMAYCKRDSSKDIPTAEEYIRYKENSIILDLIEHLRPNDIESSFVTDASFNNNEGFFLDWEKPIERNIIMAIIKSLGQNNSAQYKDLTNSLTSLYLSPTSGEKLYQTMIENWPNNLVIEPSWVYVNEFLSSKNSIKILGIKYLDTLRSRYFQRDLYNFVLF